MIFSLTTALKPTAEKVLHNNMPVAYSWGNEDALHKWIENQNKKQVERSLGIASSNKYPLIWLVEGWEAKQNVPGIKFEKVTFYISCNSKLETLNENRVPNFELLYAVANNFTKEIKKVLKIAEGSISYSERANFSTKDRVNDKTYTSDVWDTLIVKMDLIINTNCLKKCGL
jgi:hypothetical protein